MAGAPGRAGLSIASSVAGVGELVREQSGLTGDADWPRTAAASSLHAVAAAAEALRAGNLDLAVAGGAELGLDPAWLTAAARAGTLGRDEMRVYAAEPCGLLPGEGCGIVVLVRSADAHAAGVPIYAEIAGWSTVPVSPSALDDRAILQAYRQAGIDPADIQLIEGEGRGTAAGDLAELTAFGRLRQGGRATAALGAVAAGIGYTRAAAGIASLIKTALAMAVGTIPSGHPVRAAAPADRDRGSAAAAAAGGRTVAGREHGRLRKAAGRGQLARHRGPGGRAGVCWPPAGRRGPSGAVPRSRAGTRAGTAAPHGRYGKRIATCARVGGLSDACAACHCWDSCG